MADPKKFKLVTGSFHGGGDTDAGVVTETTLTGGKTEHVEVSEHEDVSRRGREQPKAS